MSSGHAVDTFCDEQSQAVCQYDCSHNIDGAVKTPGGEDTAVKSKDSQLQDSGGGKLEECECPECLGMA